MRVAAVRLTRFISLVRSTHSVKTAMAAARSRSQMEVLSFLGAGGKLRGTQATIAGWHCSLAPAGWGALRWVPEHLERGTVIVQSDTQLGEYEIATAAGFHFVSDSAYLSDTLVVLKETFLEQQYAELNVRDAVVLDVGASVGDSAIYFASRGAARVIAYEPLPETVRRAMVNVRRNSLSDCIEIKCAAVGAANGHAPTSASKVTTQIVVDVTDMTPGSTGVGTEVVAVGDVMRQMSVSYPHKRIVCKLDCEGGEYSILDAMERNNLLPLVSKFILEFHGRGADPLEKIFVRSGFEILRSDRGMGLGLIHARRNSDRWSNGG